MFASDTRLDRFIRIKRPAGTSNERKEELFSKAPPSIFQSTMKEDATCERERERWKKKKKNRERGKKYMERPAAMFCFTIGHWKRKEKEKITSSAKNVRPRSSSIVTRQRQIIY